MQIWFSHGKESGPWGSKIKRLAAVAKEYGYQVDSVDYTGLTDPDLRVERLLSRLQGNSDGTTVLVGSSMGGYVSLVAAEQIAVTGLFLLAPALYLPGYKMEEFSSDYPFMEIVHGWSDDVIPPENSIRFAQQKNCSLHLIDGDHRLNSSIATVENIFRGFLDNIAKL